MQEGKVLLSALRIAGFRSCTLTEFCPRPDLSVLIGRNGAGKTNILQAVKLLRAWSHEPRFGLSRDTGMSTSQCSISAEFQIDACVLAMRSTITYVLDDENSERIVKVADEWREGTIADASINGEKWLSIHPLMLSISLKEEDSDTDDFANAYEDVVGSAVKSDWAALNATSEGFRKNVRRALTFRNRISYYSASQFTNPGACPTSLDIDADRPVRRITGMQKRDHRGFIADLYREYAAQSKMYSAYMSIVGRHGLKLINEIKWKKYSVPSREVVVRGGGRIINRKRQRFLIVPSISIGGEKLSFSQLSEGSFKALALIFYLVTDDKDLLLIEEPEVCVHHGLLASVIELMKSQSATSQMIVSTHSDFVLDKLKPEQVYSVSNSARKGTTVHNLEVDSSPKELQRIKRYLSQEGNLGDLWRQGGIEN